MSSILHRVIPISIMRLQRPVMAGAPHAAGPAIDQLRRPLRDLRISLTDRCNFRCSYCMPSDVFGKDYEYLPRDRILSFEEIETVATAAIAAGVEKLRLTGGEPLLRKDIELLVARLSALRTPLGRPVEVTLTTNGSLLRCKARSLRDAGMDRLTVSLDALDAQVFTAMSGSSVDIDVVLDGIGAAIEAGMKNIKVNTVVQRGVNEDQIIPIVRRFRGTGVTPRFIEYMDAGATNRWNMREVVPSAELVKRIDKVFPLAADGVRSDRATSRTFQFADGIGSVGFISSVTEPFCADCTRLRLTADGRLFTCLFGAEGLNLRPALRRCAGPEEIQQEIRNLWGARSDRYSEERGKETGKSEQRHAEMSLLGG